MNSAVPDDGGPAFPAIVKVRKDLGKMAGGDAFTFVDAPTPGMSLRDYMAMHAPADWSETLFPTAKIAAVFLKIKVEDYRSDLHWPSLDASARYVWADAMLAARKDDGKAPESPARPFVIGDRVRLRKNIHAWFMIAEAVVNDGELMVMVKPGPNYWRPASDFELNPLPPSPEQPRM